MRRLIIIATAVTLLLPTTAHARAVKQTLTEDWHGVSRMNNEDGLAQCIGYRGFLEEWRHGAYHVTAGKRSAHIEGKVDGRIRVFPAPGQVGATYTGRYVEHLVGRIQGDTPWPLVMFQLRGTAHGDDGSALRFHTIGQTHVDTHTGDLRRDRYTLNCSVNPPRPAPLQRKIRLRSTRYPA